MLSCSSELNDHNEVKVNDNDTYDLMTYKFIPYYLAGGKPVN